MRIFGKEISISLLIILLLLILLAILLILCWKRSKDRKLQRIIDDLSILHPRLKHLDIRSITHCRLRDSYTENKKILFICICDPEGEYYSDNKIKQVIIHELAHALSFHVDEKHRSLEYLTIYNSLILRAELLNLINTAELKEGIVYPDGRKRKFKFLDTPPSTSNIIEHEGDEDEQYNDIGEEEEDDKRNVKGLGEIIKDSTKETKNEEMTKKLFDIEDDTVKVELVNKEDFNEIEEEDDDAEEDAGQSVFSENDEEEE
jgi:hypothetical protein